MKKMKFNMVAARSVAFGGLLGLLLGAQAASACTLNNWSAVVGLDETDASQGTIAPGSPNPTAPNEVLSPRYSGLCAMKASGEGYVQDNNPGGIGRIIARFYVLANNTENAVIYRGFDSGGNELFNVSLAANGQVTLSSGGTSTDPVAGVSGNWNSIEIDWNAPDGNDPSGLVLTVNNEPPASVDFSASSMVDSVRLGNLDGAAGTMNFDAYESRRSTPVGRLCQGDANSDGVRDFVDIGDIFIESATGGNTPANGNPDFNEDGKVDFVDIGEVFILSATGQGDCT